MANYIDERKIVKHCTIIKLQTIRATSQLELESDFWKRKRVRILKIHASDCQQILSCPRLIVGKQILKVNSRWCISEEGMQATIISHVGHMLLPTTLYGSFVTVSVRLATLNSTQLLLSSVLWFERADRWRARLVHLTDGYFQQRLFRLIGWHRVKFWLEKEAVRFETILLKNAVTISNEYKLKLV